MQKIINNFKEGDVITFPDNPIYTDETVNYPHGVSIVRRFCEVIYNGERKNLSFCYAKIFVTLFGNTKTMRLLEGTGKFLIDFDTHVIAITIINYKLVEYNVCKKISIPDVRESLIQRFAGKTIKCESSQIPLGSTFKFVEISDPDSKI